MKILFINVPLANNYSLSCQPVITILASNINRRGKHTAKIYDLSFSGKKKFNHFQRELKCFSPDVLAFNSESILGFNELSQIITKVSEISKTPIIIGGFHVNLNPILYQGIKAIKYIASGDGNKILCSFLDAIESKKIPQDIPGLWVRGLNPEGEKKCCIFDKEHNIFPLDWSMWESLEKNLYYTGKLSYVGNRGCAGNCTFCSNSEINGACDGSFHRMCDPEKYAYELVDCFNKHQKIGLKLLRLHDANITEDHKWCTTFCEKLIQIKPEKFYFQAFSNINTLNEKMARLLSRAGCIRFCTGIECGSPEIREKLYNKHIPNSKIKKFIKLSEKYNISVMAFYIFGGPGENRSSLSATLNMIIRLKTAQYGLAKFVPFTRKSKELLAQYSKNSPENQREKLKTISFSNFYPFSFSSFGQEQLPAITVELFQLIATIIILWRQWVDIIRIMKFSYLSEMFVYFCKGFGDGLSLVPLLVNYHIKYCDYRMIEITRNSG